MSALAAEAADQTWYQNHLDHLDAELQLLDLILARAVVAMRRDGPGASGSQDVYVTHDEVDRLLDPQRVADSDRGAHVDLDLRIGDMRRAIDGAARHGQHHGVVYPLLELADRLDLSAFEYQAVVTCLAPELDRKYDRLYCYLQDDITRKRPSVDLVLSLLCRDAHERWERQRTLAAPAPLRRYGILHEVADPHSPSGSTALATFLAVDERITGHLLGAALLDEALTWCADVVAPQPGPALADPGGVLAEELAGIVSAHVSTDHTGLVVYLRGARGAGSAAIVHAASASLETALVHADCPQGPSSQHELEGAVTAAIREGWLLGVPVLLADADRVLDGSGAQALGRAMLRHPAVVFVTGETAWPCWNLPIPVHEASVAETSLAGRAEAWAVELDRRAVTVPDGAVHDAASRYQLTPGQIADAAKLLARRAAARGDHQPFDVDDVYEACRAQSSRSLDELAQRTPVVHGWDDLVVPDRSRAQLEEMCQQVRLRDRVLDEWALGRKVAPSRGVAALFTGPPGTGKTMAAGVVANDLGLDLYRIDLSQVVSKYIGETEKNLARIFGEARTANAVLFFDEADALFGKRTVVTDAHDRYANIETSYLLQEMEGHDGVAILATNLQQNMDEAFMRRLGFVVDFPFPDPARRLEIWERHLGGDAPVNDDVVLDELAARLAVSGANIRNIVLAAAYLAAAEDESIGMAHLVRAAEREFEKVGKLWTEWEATG